MYITFDRPLLYIALISIKTKEKNFESIEKRITRKVHRPSKDKRERERERERKRERSEWCNEILMIKKKRIEDYYLMMNLC